MSLQGSKQTMDRGRTIMLKIEAEIQIQIGKHAKVLGDVSIYY